jgi:hypothetical protein
MEIHFPDGMINHICHEFKSENHQEQKESFASVTFIFVGRGSHNKNGYVWYSKNRLSYKKSNMRVKEQSGFVNLSNTRLYLLISFTKHDRQQNPRCRNLRRMDMVHMNQVAISDAARR